MLTEIIRRAKPDIASWASETLYHAGRAAGHKEVMKRKKKKPQQEFTAAILNRQVSNAHNTQNFFGKIVRNEGDESSGDHDVDRAYKFMGDVWEFYNKIFSRNSLDNNGMTLKSTVHFGKSFDNAFWNGQQMIFGDGDGVIFKNFTSDVSIIGHEFTHGVTQHTAKLSYHDQQGALNESISDVFGSMIKQYTLNQDVNQADWVVGDKVLMHGINGVGVRSLAAPGTAYDDSHLGKDPCPATMLDYVNTESDRGGIHINCTIPSHAFYIASKAIGGYSWEKFGKVWYRVLTNKVRANTDFKTFANQTIKTCQNIFGNGEEIKILRSAWHQVKVL
jgi:Zn-dependent metalloprotease